jgi:predicted flap endonuclease-1-like 5' DNA nuclease
MGAWYLQSLASLIREPAETSSRIKVERQPKQKTRTSSFEETPAEQKARQKRRPVADHRVKNNGGRTREKTQPPAELEDKPRRQSQRTKALPRAKEQQPQIVETPPALAGQSELEDRVSPVTASRMKEEADFTRIRGIGPSFDQRLKKANLLTFSDLASRTPKQVAKILACPVDRVIRSRIIEQARELTNESGA